MNKIYESPKNLFYFSNENKKNLKGDIMEAIEDLKKTYRTTLIIAASIIVSLPIYAFVVEFIRYKFRPFSGFLALAEVQLLRYPFYGVAALEIFAIGLLRSALLKESPAEDPKMFLAKLNRASIITQAFCELPAILGLTLFLIGGLHKDFYILLFLSFFMQIIYFPRFNNWQEKLKRRFLSSRFQGGTK